MNGKQARSLRKIAEANNVGAPKQRRAYQLLKQAYKAYMRGGRN